MDLRVVVTRPVCAVGKAEELELVSLNDAVMTLAVADEGQPEFSYG